MGLDEYLLLDNPYEDDSDYWCDGACEGECICEPPEPDWEQIVKDRAEWLQS